MPTEFPFVVVPEKLLPIIGEPDEGTRVYRKRAAQEDAALWHEVVANVAGGTVSPGGVLMFCPVSRAAVYKRMQDGKLTAFNFYPTGRKTKFFGGLISVREMPYCYIPVSEAKAWRKELEERAVAQGKITQAELDAAKREGGWVYKILEHAKMSVEELEGKKPDPDGFFLELDSKQHKASKKKKGGAK
jgi:hypothetical protein